MEDFGSLLSILNTYDCKTRADSVDWYEDDVTGMYHLRINLVIGDPAMYGMLPAVRNAHSIAGPRAIIRPCLQSLAPPMPLMPLPP